MKIISVDYLRRLKMPANSYSLFQNPQSYNDYDLAVEEVVNIARGTFEPLLSLEVTF